MNNEKSSRGFRGEIKHYMKDKWPVVASSAVLIAASAGSCEAINSDESSGNDYQELGANVYMSDIDISNMPGRYQEFVDEIYSGSDSGVKKQEIELEENKDVEVGTPRTAPTQAEDYIYSTSEPYIPLPIAEVPSVVAQGSEKTLQNGESLWIVLADCETGDAVIGPPYYAQWDYNGSSGFDGGLQFLPSTWNMLKTGYDFAWQAPAEVQIEAAQRWLELTDWYQWPACYDKMRAAGYLD